ncbi:MAG: hypothetical protein AAF603_05755, partial [Pseudomonadota bacterium]
MAGFTVNFVYALSFKKRGNLRLAIGEQSKGTQLLTLRQKAAVLSASILGSSMAFVNGTAVTLALDPIQLGLSASLGQILWVASIYMLFISALMLIGGAIGDFYGRR